MDSLVNVIVSGIKLLKLLYNFEYNVREYGEKVVCLTIWEKSGEYEIRIEKVKEIIEAIVDDS